MIAHYERRKAEFAAHPGMERAWITNKNWVIATPMETGVAPRERAIPLLDQIRHENSGEYGPWLSAIEKQAMMTISTGVQAVAEGEIWAHGRGDVVRGPDGPDVQSRNAGHNLGDDAGLRLLHDRVDHFGIVLPLIEHVFGIRPDAANKTIVFEPHLSCWLGRHQHRGAARRREPDFLFPLENGARHRPDVEADDDGWTLVLREKASPGSRYFLNGRPIAPSPSGIRMEGRKNRLLMTSVPQP